jgi:hypothetical protein
MKTIYIKTLFLALILGVSVSSCKKEGCTNTAATNYDSTAKKDNGSCTLPEKPKPAAAAPKPDAKAPSKTKPTAGALDKFGKNKGKGTGNVSKNGDDRNSGSGNDVTYTISAWGFIIDDDGYGSEAEDVVLVILDDNEDVVYIDAVESDFEGYYEFNWTLTQDEDLPPPSREIYVFTYDEILDEICYISTDFDYYDFDELSDTDYEYEVELLLECD